MPSLFKFAEAHTADASRFAIITFHHGMGEKTLAECQGKFDGLLKSKWKREKFPFPILMDATDQTLRAWGVNAFPTAVLLDPEGNIVRKDHHGIEELLAEELKKQKEKSPAPDKP